MPDGFGLPSSRVELRDWVLKKLGAPVLEINVADEQIEDRISEALAFFRDFHFDGVEKVLYKHKITASQLIFNVAIVNQFKAPETITGLTSGAVAGFVDQATNNLSIRVHRIAGTFIAGETVKGNDSNTTAVLAPTNFLILGDLDNGYVPVDDSIIGVTDVLPFRSSLPSSGSIFDINYQFALNSMHSLISTDVITYTMFRTQMELLRQTFSGIKGFRFNRNTDKVYLDIDWKGGILAPDEYIVLVCYKAVDPEAYTEVYSDFFVREYCYALMKKQWGENLKKFSGIALPGNVVMNGQIIFDEAMQYIEKLEIDIDNKFTLPCDFLIG